MIIFVVYPCPPNEEKKSSFLFLIYWDQMHLKS